jgi:adenine deaminase
MSDDDPPDSEQTVDGGIDVRVADGGVDSRALEAVALGERPADVVVVGGRVLHPDGEFRDRAVAVVGDPIAALPDDGDAVTGPDTGSSTLPGRR